jgi:hypothetical protein
MSAYIVKYQTINRVVEWLYWEITISSSLKTKLERATGIDTAGYDWQDTLGKFMFDLNVAGVNARYGEGAAGKFCKLNYSYQPVHGTPIQVLKSLQCFLYQCTEGEVVKEPLYRFLQDTVEPYRMGKIIAALPEYEAAEWG